MKATVWNPTHISTCELHIERTHKPTRRYAKRVAAALCFRAAPALDHAQNIAIFNRTNRRFG